MRKFIFKLSVFVFLPTMIYYSGMALLKLKFKKVIDKKQIFVFGDSQTWHITSNEVYNRSLGAIPYFVHYEFVKEYINQIKGKSVYIGYNYHNIGNGYQNRLWNDSMPNEWRVSTFRHLDEYNIFNYRHPELRPFFLNYYFFDVMKLPRLFKRIYFPISPKSSGKKIEIDTVSIHRKVDRFWRKQNQLTDDSIQRKYLLKLISILKENNCKVILLKMPVIDYFERTVPEKIKKDLVEIPSKTKIRILDINKQIQISNNYSYFKDFIHLDTSGIRLVNNFLFNHEMNTIINKQSNLEND